MASDERRLLSAKRLCAGRKMRREEFPEELFGDYSWSMLMLGYIAQLEDTALTPEDMFEKAGASRAVGERWAAFLVQQELLTLDGEVRLTPTAVDRMARYLDRVIEIASGEAPV